MAKTEAERIALKKLSASCVALKVADGKKKKPGKTSLTEAGKILKTYYSDCKEYFNAFTLALDEIAHGQETSTRGIAFSTGLSPRITPTFWLGHLNLDQYALSIIELRQAQTLLRLLSTPDALAEELSHVGHKNRDPLSSPEILLLEAESDIRIRPEQERIAHTMRSPPNSSNSVMQLLMGKGKSSVIMPMVTVALADGKK